MKVKAELQHTDEISGMWIMDDGTKCYWSESGSDSVIIMPCGKRIVVEAYTSIEEYRDQLGDDLTNVIADATNNGSIADECRTMTDEEEREYDLVKYGEEQEE